MMMSAPDVPTVKPEATTVPELSSRRALFAVPVASATSDKGRPENERAPEDTVPTGLFKTIVARAEVIEPPAVAAEPITSFAPLPKAVTTAERRVFLTVVEYVTAINIIP
jgi:hypothetical protein